MQNVSCTRAVHTLSHLFFKGLFTDCFGFYFTVLFGFISNATLKWIIKAVLIRVYNLLVNWQRVSL